MVGELSHPFIRIQNLTKKFGEITAVSSISTEIHKGEVVGFLGPNGAGKTTTMRMLTTYLPPTSGNAWVDGWEISENPDEVRKLIGYLPEFPPLYPEMRVERYLKFVAHIKGVPSSQIQERLEWTIYTCGLQEMRTRVIKTLSRGYRQRVGLAQALIHDPKVLILDEPTSGLDPKQIREIRETIREIGKERTVLLSTHILQEVVTVCNRVLIIHRGKIVYDAPLSGQPVEELEKIFFQLTQEQEREETESSGKEDSEIPGEETAPSTSAP